MKIPKQVTIGNTPHLVCTKNEYCVQDVVPRFFNEETAPLPSPKGNPLRGYKYDADERSNTFWHELTHAILYDMGNKLTHDEKFVTEFADRLDQAIKTARF
jgi:hypothetical protein